ncbi:response regulator [Flammeovirga sp. OC4]|uniref:response regulator n=1 Tax=Flammeovirga sp. OC4 TaxID=1382345 RepID=UPI0012E0515B|nr:response regulator [Flammeovirga sp. OC4]
MTMAFSNSIERPMVQNKAIVVDNNIINAHYLKKILMDEGLDINVITETSQLFTLVDNPSVKMVFLDSETLGMYLQETINKLQDYCEANDREITIVGTTPYSLAGARKKLLNLGVQYALSTPIYKKHLAEILSASIIA